MIDTSHTPLWRSRSGIVLLGLLAERFFDLEVTRRQWVGLGLLGLTLILLLPLMVSLAHLPNFGFLLFIVHFCHFFVR